MPVRIGRSVASTSTFVAVSASGDEDKRREAGVDAPVDPRLPWKRLSQWLPETRTSGGPVTVLNARLAAVAKLRPRSSNCLPHCSRPDPNTTRGGPITSTMGRL
ncbi:MAG: hypothetical protein FRX49_02775 [Trebouxia sp. A1-2]|nr:MAG: hypothetical protein FRX49_02775 [Trebouxia sp. A1-2]